MRKIFLVLSILFLYSCEDNIMGNSEIEFTFLDIYLETTLDENGYYHLEYTSTSEQVYQAVYFQTTSTQRVHWDSPNNLIINWNGFEFEQPIISYSTYADENGNISIDKEAVCLEILPLSMAVHNCGGKVIAQVEKIVKNGYKTLFKRLCDVCELEIDEFE